MVMRTREQVRYGITGPFMNRSVPPNQVAPGSFSELAGVDGRIGGCVRKFFGMKEVVDLDSVDGNIDLYDGPSFFKYVTFHKYGFSITYRGFVVRWDEANDNTNEAVDLFYYDGTSWASHEIWAQSSSSITSTTKMDCATDGKFLMVAIDGKATKTVYWNGSALTTVDSGPGVFSSMDSTAALTADASVVDSSYELSGGGRYRVAWRFYDSTRGIYSALSTPVTVTCDNYQTTKATGTISFNSGGGDSGLMVAGDFFTINSKKYEYISDNSADVVIAAAAGATVAQHCTALADAVNGYSSTGGVTARAATTTVLLEAVARGSVGNAYTLADDESAGNPDDLTVSGATFAGGGVSTEVPEKHVKATMNFPANTAIVATKTYTHFDALFDTVEVFRTIDLGDSVTSGGAIFYKESEIAKSGNWATSGTWDTLTYTLGTKLDEALPFLLQYNPETDVCSAPPQSGSIGRYQETTFMGQASATRGGVDTLHSSTEHLSPEYFTTFNDRRADMDEGKPLRYVNAADGMFVLSENAVIHAYKASKTAPLQFVKLHQGRGLTGQGAAHVVGNSVFMLTPHGLIILNGSDGSMGQVSSVDRLLIDDWVNDLGTIQSGYDSLLNCSFFLHPGDSEILQLYHSTQSTSMLEGANFAGCTSGPDTVDMADVRCYFITSTGRIVVPDVDASGSGTMWGLTGAVTLNGTTTAASASQIQIIDSSATFDADMVGALVYFTTGANAGLARKVTSQSSSILACDTFSNTVAQGDKYAVSPVPFKIRLWPLRDPDPRQIGDAFKRWVVTGVSLKSRKHVGFSSNDCDFWRIGFYRNSQSTIDGATTTSTTLDFDTNPADSVVHLSIAGIDVEPYIEHISSGTTFELTNAEVTVMMVGSRDSADAD